MIDERLGKWRIFKELGRGGMGRVYLAQEEGTGRQAAVKILAGELAQDIGFLQRFQREIETLSQLTHPNIVRFYESGCENGHYFYAMEYVEGHTLDEALEEQKRLPWRDVLDLALQLCPALRHVHDHGVIHRDLKPSNIIRTPAGQVKLMDFGIAKIFASTHLTATGGVVGTAEFISPEQASGKPVTKRSDLYSLGVVLYILLVGRPPFEGNGVLDLLHKHRYAQFDKPQQLVPEIPYEIDEIVCQLLEKDPARRPPDCLVLYKQLDSLRKRLDRRLQHTELSGGNDATLAEQRTDLTAESLGLPGPATLMSKLMREELERQKRGSALSQFINHPAVLVTLLAVVIGLIVWGMWPLDRDTLFERGARLMASSRLSDMNQAWREYLEPLERRFPDHPYQEEVEKFRIKRDAALNPQPTEAQHFYQLGERLRHEGNERGAREIWSSLATAFAGNDADRDWVQRARKGLAELEKKSVRGDRLKTVQPILERAAALKQEGKVEDADKIWTALETLYRNDLSAAEVLAEIRKQRGK
ncbi:MAG: protein kinase [Gemmataceae bacterium]|nr:protein kinase [Gemmataceae bacterium]